MISIFRVGKRIKIGFFLMFAGAISMAAQISVKTNLISDVLLSPNIGVEMKVAPHWSVDLTGQVNFWELSRHHYQWKHWLVQPEARYWLCSPFSGHFFAINASVGEYDIANLKNNVTFLGTKFKDLSHHRFQGWGAGAGIAYGYSWILARHWNIEAEIGIGWVYSRYDEYNCVGCEKKISSNKVHNYVGPTKLAVNLEYIF